jgi:hypothetical protein
VFTPDEVIKTKCEGERCVEFDVAVAGRPSALQADPTEPFPIILEPALNKASRDKFFAIVTGKAVSRLKAGGKVNPYSYFRGKKVRVTGTVRRTPHDEGITYELLVENAKAIAVQEPAGAPAASIGYVKAEARGHLIHRDGKYRLLVRQNKPWPEMELLIQTNADKSHVSKVVAELQESEVIVTGNITWLPKTHGINSDADYALGIMIRDEAQIGRVVEKDLVADHLKVEAKGRLTRNDHYHLHVQLQEKPARKLVFGFLRDEPHPLLRNLAALKDRDVIVTGQATWNPQTKLDFGFGKFDFGFREFEVKAAD